MRIAMVRRSRSIPVNLRRIGAFALAFAGIAVWLMAGATLPPPSPARHSVPVATPGLSPAAPITRLHPLRPAAAPPLQARDLFRYGAKMPAVAIEAAAGRVGEQAVPAAIPGPVPFVLAGLAEDDGAGGPIRTAIISGAGQLFLVKQGEPVTDRYRVAMIASDHVELTDALNGTVLRLGLR